MKLFRPTLITLIVFTMSGCSDKKELKASDLKFESIFGAKDKKGYKIYSLLGTGFWKAPSSANSDQLIAKWLNNHPDGKVIPVSTLENITYCWIVDGKDTINNYLIKNGCFPGGTMNRPETYEEMSPEMRSAWGEFKLKVHMEKKSYGKYLKQIQTAENFAKVHKLGIWTENFTMHSKRPSF